MRSIPDHIEREDRLSYARSIRPLCQGQLKPHIFKLDGFWRVSIMPGIYSPQVRRMKAPERYAVRRLWTQAHTWLGENMAEPRSRT